ncbi:MAG: S8 family serine peptidase [Bacteroidales bacterium]|nr:S8 family serine peptidase [Bacteroidales bacterium]
MKGIIYILATAFICFIAGYFFISLYNIEYKPVNIKIIAHFNEEVISGNTLITQVNDIKDKNIRKLFARFDVVELQAAYTNRYNNKGFLKQDINTSTPSSWQHIILKDNGRAEKLVAKLKKEKGVLNTYIEKPIELRPGIAPTDSEYGSQWHLNSISSPLADIDAEQAWNINTGRSDVIVAVCDGGVDYTHPDLDLGDRSRVIAGYDFGSGDNDPMDDLGEATGSYGGHGTHVAGIIGAIPNNGQVAGVMWNCKIMPIKMVGGGSLTFSFPFGTYNWDFSTTAFPSDVADAIDYSVNNGAHVINLSYGFDDMGALINDVILRVPLLYDAILNAYNSNVVIVAAMGNEYERGNPTQYPAAFSEVIAVGNTTNDNPPTRWGSSSIGSHICVSAPGRNILSTIRGGGTGSKTGTSMAAPVVSGVAGLIISQGMDRNFNLTNDDVRHILERTAVDIGTTGFDNETGHGIVNANNALQLLDEPNEVFHYNTTGGTSVKTQTLSQWILLSNQWGLAAGTYTNVDQYKITKHITFDVPFCSTPQVWMRERESKSLSYANPNSGRPYAIITNITNTGFDLEYVAYYVRSNIIGQTINKWIPTIPDSTNVAYTALGEADFASTIGPISGSSSICTSNSTYTINNLPSGSSVNWTHSNKLSYVSGQGTANYTVSALSNSIAVPDTITATISNVSCQDIIIHKEVYLSPDFSNFEIQVPVSPINGDYDFVVWASGLPSQITNYNWTVSNGYIVSQDLNEIIIHPTSCIDPRQRPVTINVTAINDCGSATAYASVPVDCDGGIINPLSVQPNPANNYIDAEIINDDSEIDNNELHIKLFNNRSIPVYTGNSNQKSFRVQTSHLPRGLYILQVIYKEKKYSKQVLIEH